MPHRIFLLSPAHCGGKRAGYLLREGASFNLAKRIREPEGASIADVFSFLSGLYFRGKVAYARRFSKGPSGTAGALVITTQRGLVPIDTRLTLDELREMGTVDIDPTNPLYHEPLRRDALALAAALEPEDEVVLLGSIATGKYVDILSAALGNRLRFPAEFVGRGDMSRGGLMLRCVQEERELTYVPVEGAERRGKRPARLERVRGRSGRASRKPKSDPSRETRIPNPRIPESNPNDE